ncbi:hypothetical protein [Streptomyces triculaminicus]|uniref:hypothetical protein n=1 Tax=Streptomyces triculaminicus TaxID=2816232 RepID=UPI0037A18053
MTIVEEGPAVDAGVLASAKLRETVAADVRAKCGHITADMPQSVLLRPSRRLAGEDWPVGGLCGCGGQ